MSCWIMFRASVSPLPPGSAGSTASPIDRLSLTRSPPPDSGSGPLELVDPDSPAALSAEAFAKAGGARGVGYFELLIRILPQRRGEAETRRGWAGTCGKKSVENSAHEPVEEPSPGIIGREKPSEKTFPPSAPPLLRASAGTIHLAFQTDPLPAEGRAGHNPVVFTTMTPVRLHLLFVRSERRQTCV